MTAPSSLTPWRVIGHDGDSGIARLSADNAVMVHAHNDVLSVHINGTYSSMLKVSPEVIAEAARCCIRAGLLTAEELVP